MDQPQLTWSANLISRGHAGRGRRCPTEQAPLIEDGNVGAFPKCGVLPHAANAWYVPDSVKNGYKISVTRYFYKPQSLRSLEEIRADILALGRETEGLLGGSIGGKG